jgi:carbon monoxide dehydrogenase subunit G
MPRVEEAVVIDRPPEEVFAYVTTPENDREWVSTAVERQREDEGPIRVGSRIRAVDRFLGRRIESTLEVTAHEPNTRSDIRLEGPIAARGSYLLEPVDGRTRFRWVLDAEAGLGGLYLGKVTDPLVTLLFRRRVRFDLRRLKDALERRAGSSSEGRPGGAERTEDAGG